MELFHGFHIAYRIKEKTTKKRKYDWRILWARIRIGISPLHSCSGKAQEWK
jgi:hypothetical protein